MPELPEVETVRRTLAPAIGMRVTQVWTSGKPLRLNQPVERDRLASAAEGRRIEDIRRWGKYLLIDFAVAPGEEPTHRSGGGAFGGDACFRRGRPVSILVHLGMSGRLRLMSKAKLSAARPLHTHVVFSLSGRGGAHELCYSDPRRFGQVTWVERGAEREHPSLSRLGVDPLLGDLEGAYLHERARGSRRTLKTYLLDQSVIAGVGNIYASEALWQARLHPAARAHRLGRARADVLARAVHEVLERALDNGGTTLRDFVNADGVEGSHAHYLWVYDREGQPCMRTECGQAIRRTVIQGRATYHCPACQKR
jgi:formamidopyrimidine-DNA glycosylase